MKLAYISSPSKINFLEENGLYPVWESGRYAAFAHTDKYVDLLERYHIRKYFNKLSN